MTGFAAFLGATLGGLACCLALGATTSTGLLRRIALSGCLLWIAGWITVAPLTASRDPADFYLLSLLFGAVLLAASLVLRRADTADRMGAKGGSAISGRFAVGTPSTTLLLAAAAFAVPGAIGVLFGAELLTLTFVVAAAVTLILLFLFR
ncbi:hypothetical protein BRC87_13810 [Halobacteriales archaeon QS_4_66_20]|nr:MAG: hypothetical protein BRC87_13810 [Halobacteriales archaeon QS_4_66_20]